MLANRNSQYDAHRVRCRCSREIADGEDHLLDARLLAELASGVVPETDELLVLRTISDIHTGRR